MAIFSCRVSNIGRRSGASAVGSAAYRSGSRLEDKRNGKVYDFTKKSGIEYSEIFLPSKAIQFSNLTDRETLWNLVEIKESRVDSRLAKEVMLALPVELSVEQNKELIKEYCEFFTEKGMIADANFHNDNQNNPHVHIMLTTRKWDPEAGKFMNKKRDWNSQRLIFDIRKEGEFVINKHLILAGFEKTVDSRSFKNRNIDLEPGFHLGKNSYHSEVAESKYEALLNIKSKNAKILIENPSIGINKIASEAAIFGEKDIANLAFQNSVSSEQYNQVFDALMTMLEYEGRGENGKFELIAKDEYENPIYSTQETMKQEINMLHNATVLESMKGFELKTDHKVYDIHHKSQHQYALEFILEDKNLRLVNGLAGTGKSTLMKKVNEVYSAEGYQVLGCSLSNKAVQELEKSSQIKSKTIDSMLWEIKNPNPKNPPSKIDNKTVIVVDEASLASSRKIQPLLEHAAQNKAKVIMIGDVNQLSPIEGSPGFKALTEIHETFQLDRVYRQKELWMKEATALFGIKETEKALSLYEEKGRFIESKNKSESIDKLISDWSKDITKTDQKLILAFSNEEVDALNRKAHECLIAGGKIEKGQEVLTAKGQREFSVGEQIMFLRNDRTNGITNNQIGVISNISNKDLQIVSDDKTINVNLEKYNDIDYAYAMSIHKSQGVTVENTYFLTSRNLNAPLTYVACSRHKEDCKLYISLEEFPKVKTQEQLVEKVRSNNANKEIANDQKELNFVKTASRLPADKMAIHYSNTRHIQPVSKQNNPISKEDWKKQSLQTWCLKPLEDANPNMRISFCKNGDSVQGNISNKVKLQNGQEVIGIREKNTNTIYLVKAQHSLERFKGDSIRCTIGEKGLMSDCKVQKIDEKTKQVLKTTVIVDKNQKQIQDKMSR